MPSQQIDLNTDKYKVQLTNVETPPEMAARLEREKRGHDHDLWMRKAVFFLVAATVTGIGGIAAALLFIEDPSRNEMGRSVLVALLTATIGYAAGRASNSEGK